MCAPKLNILILAAGLSARLGRPKALARVHGVSLLRRSVALGAALSPRAIYVVVPRNFSRYRHEAAGFKVRFVPNPMRAAGLASSVRIGIRQAQFCAAILILPVDLPALKSRDLARLLARSRARPGRLTAARVGVGGGIPLLLPARLFAAAAALRGDAGFRTLLASLAPAPELVRLPAAETDIDTAQQLQAAQRRFRGVAG